MQNSKGKMQKGGNLKLKFFTFALRHFLILNFSRLSGRQEF